MICTWEKTALEKFLLKNVQTDIGPNNQINATKLTNQQKQQERPQLQDVYVGKVMISTNDALHNAYIGK